VLGTVPINAGAVADAWRNVIDAACAAALSDTYDGIAWTGRYMDDPTTVEDNGTAPTDGAIAGDRLPTFNAVTIQLIGDGRGRSFRGSKHFGPVAESDTILDNLDTVPLGRWDAIRVAIDGGLQFFDAAGNTWQLIILSRTLSDLTANPSVFTGCHVAASKTNRIVGTMDRRKEKAGT